MKITVPVVIEMSDDMAKTYAAAMELLGSTPRDFENDLRLLVSEGFGMAASAHGVRRLMDFHLGLPADTPRHHPRVTFCNAINNESAYRCYPDAEAAFDAAAMERPYNNTRMSLSWCGENHDAEGADR